MAQFCSTSRYPRQALEECSTGPDYARRQNAGKKYKFGHLRESPEIGTMFENSKRVEAAAAAQSGEAELRRYLESHDPGAIEQAIAHLSEAAAGLPDSDPAKISAMINLAGAYGLRFQIKQGHSDFEAAISYNKKALALNPGAALATQAYFGIGSLQAELYKRTRQLPLLEDAADHFIPALANSTQEHPLRQLLVTLLRGMLCELTLTVPDPHGNEERWHRAFYAVPFRSLDQQALKAARRAALYDRYLLDNPQPQRPAFTETNRASLRSHAAANEALALQASTSPALTEVATYSELRRAIDRWRERYPGALIVFRGQTSFYDGSVVPSLEREKGTEAGDEQFLWTLALAKMLPHGDPDLKAQIFSSLGLPASGDGSFWKNTDLSGAALQAVLQHYGARTNFIDVSTSLETALWFAHFRFRMRQELVSLQELSARGARWDGDDPAPQFDIAWYEPAWNSAPAPYGYLFAVAPRLPEAGDGHVHGEYINLALFPSPRMKAQSAGLIYCDPQHSSTSIRTLAAFKFRLPLEGVPREVLDPSVERLFPGPDDDELYARIIWNAPFWADPGHPDIQTRRLRIPEYHSAPAARPDAGAGVTGCNSVVSITIRAPASSSAGLQKRRLKSVVNLPGTNTSWLPPGRSCHPFPP